jgi:putative IMPACT (imprinted ancient) family translation regulator
MYKSVIENKEVKLVIDKSIFFCFCFKCSDESEIKDILNDLNKKYHDASHIVFGYQLTNSHKYSDDQEPSQTAGFQLLKVLNNNDLQNVLIVCVRYFGGKKLGKAKLSKTYYEAGNMTIYENTGTYDIIQIITISTPTNFGHKLIAKHKNNFLSSDYNEPMKLEFIYCEETKELNDEKYSPSFNNKTILI